MQVMQESISHLFRSYRSVSVDTAREFYKDSLVQERRHYLDGETLVDGLDVITGAHFGRLENEPVAMTGIEHDGYLSLEIPGELLTDAAGRPHLPFEQALRPLGPSSLLGDIAQAVHSTVCYGIRPDCLGIIPCGDLRWSCLPSRRPLLTIQVASSPLDIQSFLLYTADDPLRLKSGFPSVFYEIEFPCYDIHLVALDATRLSEIMGLDRNQLLRYVGSSLEAYRFKIAV